MNIKDLKVGDLVFIREDLEHEKLYQDTMYIKEMGSGIMIISSKSRMNGGGVRFSVLGDEFSFAYSEEMIDWGKTRRLKLNESCENIKKAIRGNGIFKEIIQSGESGNETTKAITHNGEEIIVKNNNEENDIEKAVMLLMLKKLGFTYGDVKREVGKIKVKWIPAIGERFYYVSTNPTLKARALTYFIEGALKETIDSGNCFRTKEEAEEKLEKIKEVLKGE